MAADYDEAVGGATAANPQVLVTDIRMPPSFQREGIDAAKEVRKRHPGTGVVILSQYEDPEYAVSLLAEGSAGYGYLLKDHVAEGNQLADAIRAVATGGTALDPVDRRGARPAGRPGGRAVARGGGAPSMVAEGKPIKAIAAARGIPPEAAERRRGGGLRQAGRGRLRGQPSAPAPAPHAAPGHRRPGGAGRDAVPPAARRAGREAPARAPGDRRDRAGRSSPS